MRPGHPGDEASDQEIHVFDGGRTGDSKPGKL